MLSMPDRQNSTLTWTELALTAALVAVAAGASRLLAFSGGAISLFWPVAGLGIPMLHLWGWRGLLPLALGLGVWASLAYDGVLWMIPLVLLAALPGPIVVWLGTQNAFSRREQPFHRSSSTARFLKIQLLFGAPLAALLGTVALMLMGALRSPSGEIDAVAALSGWAVYWMIEACGALLVAPVAWDLMVTMKGQPWRERLGTYWTALRAQPLFLVIVPLAAVAVGSAFALTETDNARALLYLLMPLLLLISYKCNPRAALFYLMTIGVLVSAGTAFALNQPSYGANLSTIELVLLTLFLTVSAAVVLMLVSSDEDRRLALQRLERQAFTDPYTGLANEAGLQRLYAERAERGKGLTQVQLIQLRLANWQAIEQLQGASALVRSEVSAARLLRYSRPDIDWARLAPGRFVGITVDQVADKNELARLLSLLSEAVPADSQAGPVSDDAEADTNPAPLWSAGEDEASVASGSILLRPQWRASAVTGISGNQPLPLALILARLREADQLSKTATAPTILTVEHGDGSRLREAAESVEYVRQQIKLRQLVLYAQPIVPNDPTSVSGIKCEVLVRLLDRGGELLSPGQFMPVAMQGGLMQLLDQAVIEQTLDWFASHPRALDRLQQCSLNLSGPTVSNPDLASWIQTALAQRGLPADRFTFEITESQAIAQPVQAAQTLASVRSLGSRVAIDDFGTGHATFDYLKRFQVDSIKIDGSFIGSLDREPLDRVIVRSMVEVARLLKVRTVAEFVDSPEILHWTRELGIDDCQGYAMGRPQPLESLFETKPAPVIQ